MNKKIIRIVFAIGLFIPIAYLAVQLFPIFYSDYETQTAIVYTLSDGVDVEGIAVREESALADVGSGVLGYLVEDGNRISGGGVVAEVFEGQQQSESRAHENEFNRQITMLTDSQNPAQTSEGDVDIILKQQRQSLYKLLSVLDSGAYGKITDRKLELTRETNRLQIATGKASDFNDLLARLTAERDAAAAQVGTVSTLVADATGYFSSSTDGMESTCTADAIDALTPSQLEQFVQNPQAVPSSAPGKIVRDYKWYFYCVVGAESADRFQENAKVTIDFHYTGAKEVPATVVSVKHDNETGTCAVKLLCTYINSDTVNLRTEKASINFSSYTGIRVDRKAQHIVKEQRGVYVKFGDLVQFKQVDPIFENDQFLLLPIQYKEQSELNQVVLYDEIIVSGKDLYDGKLL